MLVIEKIPHKLIIKNQIIMNKKYFLIGCAAFTLLAVGTYNVSIGSGSKKMSRASISNIEALAKNENSDENNGHGCGTCTHESTGYSGIEFYCKPGNDGCHTMSCASGACL